MKPWRLAVQLAGAALAGTLIVSGLPAANATVPPNGGSSAEETVRWLGEQGHHVQINGRPNGTLAGCIVTGVSGLRGLDTDAGRSVNQTALSTVYVDIACNNTV